MDDRWKVLALTHLLAAGAGYAFAPRELLETEVAHSGFFQTDTKRILSAAVESLRAENKLLVYSWKGSATVSVERDGLLFLDGRQDLIVPGAVGYYVNLADFTLDDVDYDASSNVVTVSLPPLVMGDVAFEPEAARTHNGGLLTFNQAVVDELNRLNYSVARRVFVRSVSSPTILAAAEREARSKVQQMFALPLRAAGRPDLKVVAAFAQP